MKHFVTMNDALLSNGGTRRSTGKGDGGADLFSDGSGWGGGASRDGGGFLGDGGGNGDENFGDHGDVAMNDG